MRVSQLAHEIRNILQPVEYHLGLLEMRETSDPVQLRAMAVVPQQMRLLQQVLLNASTLDQPIEVRPRKLDLGRCVRALVSQLSLEPIAKGVKIVIHPEPEPFPISADEYWFPQALEQLLRNAIEALADCPRQDVRVEIGDEGAQVSVSIYDSGRGIDPKIEACLFEPFASIKKHGGAGLGLPIARKIIESHGGIVSLKNSPEGTCARVSIPRGVAI